MSGQLPSTIRVLVVEDKEDDFAFVRLLLSKRTIHRYELDWAPNFEAGKIAIAKSEHDVALFDHNLGLETGVRLLREAVDAGITTPIILLTGADSLQIDQEAAAGGAADYLSKASLDTIHLERSIRYALRHAATLAERRRLEKQLLSISDEEKRRIGADLHDGLGQYLTGIACLTTALRDRLDAASPEAAQANHIAGLVNEALDRTRMLARGLSPVKVEQSGLYAALQDLAYEAQQLHSIACQFKNGGPHLKFEPDTALNLYRVAQEAIHNAVRHGGASEILLRLNVEGAASRLSIEDNGRGFDPAGSEHQTGLGLHLMRHRCSLIGGSFRIQRRRPAGMVIECAFRVPNPTYES
ncbi:MAG TPA: ATP-binding protein [Opitutaceae bacterium]|jgi:signal transduction histidine kinase